MLGHLQSRVHKLGLNRQFQFLGYAPRVAQFLRNCDIFVRPSLTEGMPLTVLEAMACGLPTVASKIGGISEILTHGETGFLIEPKDTKQLAFYVSKLTKDQELRLSMGRKARSFAEKTNGWSGVALRMSQVYDSVLENLPHSRQAAAK
jgi:glycosyltransferase involved in cell wall biosynthesis